MLTIACDLPFIAYVFLAWPVVLVISVLLLTAGLGWLLNALISPYGH